MQRLDTLTPWARQVHREAQAVLDRLRARRATDDLQAATNLNRLAADVGGIRRAGSSEHRIFIGSIHDARNQVARAEFTAELGRRTIGWRPCCTCGWQGDTVYREKYDPRDPRWSDDGWPPVWVEGYASGQWENHLSDFQERDLPQRPRGRHLQAVAS